METKSWKRARMQLHKGARVLAIVHFVDTKKTQKKLSRNVLYAKIQKEINNKKARVRKSSLGNKRNL